MFVPAVVTMIPLYLTVASLRLIDTYAGIILPQIETAFLTMLLMSFFASIPDDLVDSANIDGCGYYRVLTNVIVPIPAAPSPQPPCSLSLATGKAIPGR